MEPKAYVMQQRAAEKEQNEREKKAAMNDDNHYECTKRRKEEDNDDQSEESELNKRLREILGPPEPTPPSPTPSLKAETKTLLSSSSLVKLSDTEIERARRASYPIFKDNSAEMLRSSFLFDEIPFDLVRGYRNKPLLDGSYDVYYHDENIDWHALEGWDIPSHSQNNNHRPGMICIGNSASHPGTLEGYLLFLPSGDEYAEQCGYLDSEDYSSDVENDEEEEQNSIEEDQDSSSNVEDDGDNIVDTSDEGNEDIIENEENNEEQSMADDNQEEQTLESEESENDSSDDDASNSYIAPS